MTLNIEVVGETGSVRQLADSLRQLGAGMEDAATGWHRARGTAEGVWEGQASDSFQQLAGRTGKDADELARLHTGAADALTVFADEIDTVKVRMAQAATVAREGQLVVLAGSIICEPESFNQQPGTQLGGGPLTQGANQAQTPEQHDAAKALNAKKQAAFAEAQATVNQARQAEKAAHEKLLAALNRNTEDLSHISQAGAWSQAAETATSPPAVGLAKAAVAWDQQVTGATRAMFEKAMVGGPASVSAAWASLSTAQKGDLIADHPKMIGSTNGVPAVARDQANRSMLAAQRAMLVNEINSLNPAETVRKIGAKGPEAQQYYRRKRELEEALSGLDHLTASLTPGDKFLLDLNPAENNRGQVVVANGNPDTADNVLTLVPGTFHRLSDAQDYVESNEKVLDRANQLAPDQKNATIMWGDYEAPSNLGKAAFAFSAEGAKEDLTSFQEGLRTTHEGPTQSHNTVMGHSYGSTVVGYAAREGNFPANDLMFFGSPGVGAEHPDDLGIDPNHVWSGTAGADPIDKFTPAPSPIHWGQDLVTGEDHHRFGMNPSNPHFGGNVLPTDPEGGHGGYWDYNQSRDAMARVMVGQQQGNANHGQ